MAMIKVCFADKCQFEAKIRNHTIKIDLPANLQGTDTGPMPPELFVLSLASCMGYYALFYCRKNRISAEGMNIDADYEKSINPDRISKITVKISVPDLPEEHRKGIIEAVERCLVHQSLVQKPEVQIVLE
ncbi:MAG: OsmC family protein [Candidatus Omnitrophica bacterium]|nr:OsmC family protein [Candidatus Omnitrophota bacterium]